MKAITIWQPWASLIACGVKKFETRSWTTKYRGPIAIHAALKDPRTLPPEIRDALEKVAGKLDELPRGAVIATADLVNVWNIEQHPVTDLDAPDFGDYIVPTEQEMALGDWTPGRYAWEFQNIKIFQEPTPAKGQQGLWDWKFLPVFLGEK